MRRAARIVVLPFIGLIRLYQKAVSPLLPASCRYFPCCSTYAATALKRHGLTKGLVLTGWRLLRCNPWSRGGVDHVPVVWPAGRAPVNRSTVDSTPPSPVLIGTDATQGASRLARGFPVRGTKHQRGYRPLGKVSHGLV